MNSNPTTQPLPPERGWTRRGFLAAGALTSAAVATGCATNPVTGRRQLMFYGESWEQNIDEQYSPHQFSAHYGAIQDPALNRYLDGHCKALGAESHRPHMPYTIRAVNWSVANGYTFPAGTMAVTRGLLLEMKSEAELMALIGHEVGHVAARHTAKRFSAQQFTQLLIVGAAIAVGTRDETTGLLVGGLGMIGSGLLFAQYSRRDEHQADRLGLQYSAAAGYPPQGMLDLHATLIRLYGSRRSVIEQMFASHPMSQDRYDRAVERAGRPTYAEAAQFDPRRESYMDRIALVRSQEKAIRKIQEGDKEIGGGNLDKANVAYKQAIKENPSDYEALLKTAQCYMRESKYGEARTYATQARQAYPEEFQAMHVLALANLNTRNYDAAREGFVAYGKALPGNPETVFLIGRSEEGRGQRQAAAEQYKAYLQAGGGPNADHARNRLTEWGMLPS